MVDEIQSRLDSGSAGRKKQLTDEQRGEIAEMFGELDVLDPKNFYGEDVSQIVKQKRLYEQRMKDMKIGKDKKALDGDEPMDGTGTQIMKLDEQGV
jgi:hypothetical protein